MAMEVLESSNTAGMFGSCSGSIEANPTGVPNTLMDYWSGNVSRVHRKSKHSSVPSQPLLPGMPSSLLGAASACDGSDMWSQDERELKRQRRKQSNRESARRSRLRKQAECEELSTRVDALAVENAALRSELGRLMEERNKLAQENVTLMEQVLEKSQHEQDTMFAPS
ncbi:G-box-binding factor 1 isoform X1 [Selaginella moellendorffii]|uniref:G-box-binding factor 1 isoform X1 n=1 Tax=Selaginella moellendorffii TaxID=88036 RepID=UPI000D1C2EC2|nr:G-box-binding factor 1 isoform X1 [Selaginella moellendorffii]|eukprot:XP_024518719.1 G-box-binding factor 1 isoform X1 [Selaginella moellendorffii]